MTLAPNLSLRLTSILLLGFIVMQACLWMAMTLPPRGEGGQPYNLPTPRQVEVMAETLEASPPDRRDALLETFDGSLYSVRLASGPTPPEAPGLASLRRAYAAAMPGREVSLSAGRPRLGRLFSERPRLASLFAQVSLGVSLANGERLTVDSGASSTVRRYLRRRALLGAVGAMTILLVLALAVRQTTRPLVRLSQSVRGFAGDLSAPDLPTGGSREMRELSAAFNDMKARIGGLMAQRTRVLAAVAHDMRTYLTRLRLRAEFIDDAEQRAKAVSDLDEMAALLDDTLLFASQDAEPAPALAELDLAAELEAVVALRRELGEAVSLTPIAAPLAVRASPIALRRMLANLIDNGLRHGGRVVISARADGRAVEIQVADDGPGVPADALARLGEPFGRLDPSRDRQSGGAGLGLAIVKALARRQDAAVRFANGAQRGFVVTLIFPAATHPRQVQR